MQSVEFHIAVYQLIKAPTLMLHFILKQSQAWSYSNLFVTIQIFSYLLKTFEMFKCNFIIIC